MLHKGGTVRLQQELSCRKLLVTCRKETRRDRNVRIGEGNESDVDAVRNVHRGEAATRVVGKAV